MFGQWSWFSRSCSTRDTAWPSMGLSIRSAPSSRLSLLLTSSRAIDNAGRSCRWWQLGIDNGSDHTDHNIDGNRRASAVVCAVPGAGWVGSGVSMR